MPPSIIKCFLPGFQATPDPSNNSCSFSQIAHLALHSSQRVSLASFADTLPQICLLISYPSSSTAGAAGPVTFAPGWLRPTSGSQVTTTRVPHSTLYLALLPARRAPPPKRHPTAPFRLRRPAGYVKAILVTATAFQLGSLSPSRRTRTLGHEPRPSNSSQAPERDQLRPYRKLSYYSQSRVTHPQSPLNLPLRDSPLALTLGPVTPECWCCLLPYPLPARDALRTPLPLPLVWGPSAAVRHDSRLSIMVLPPAEPQD